MLILTLRTDNPTAEIGLYDDNTQLAYESWQAHRELAETIHTKIKQLLAQKCTLEDLQGIVVYKGPGSFTGLRIGLSVANALAYSLEVPVVGSNGEDWIMHAIPQFSHFRGRSAEIVMPEYGAAAHTTRSRK